VGHHTAPQQSSGLWLSDTDFDEVQKFGGSSALGVKKLLIMILLTDTFLHWFSFLVHMHDVGKIYRKHLET
jgi:hypothetical protein